MPARAHAETFEPIIEDDVYHASDRARAPCGRGAARDDVHAVDQDRGNDREIGSLEAIGEAADQPAPVDQHKAPRGAEPAKVDRIAAGGEGTDRKSTRLNSSH